MYESNKLTCSSEWNFNPVRITGFNDTVQLFAANVGGNQSALGFFAMGLFAVVQFAVKKNLSKPNLT